MKQDLTEYGFKDDFIILHCRKCGLRIPEIGLAVLFKDNPELRATVNYGWCRKLTHGVSLEKVMK